MRLIRVGMVALLGLALVPAGCARQLHTVRVDGSAGVMPLVVALAEAYQRSQSAATIELGGGLGSRARLEALAEGRIDVAMARS